MFNLRKKSSGEDNRKGFSAALQETIEQDDISLFRSWEKDGFPFDEYKYNPNITEKENRCYQKICQIEKTIVAARNMKDRVMLSRLAEHSSPWVRLAAALNPETPMWVIWGDGENSFGLAGDNDIWVQIAAIHVAPVPPIDVIAGVKKMIDKSKNTATYNLITEDTTLAREPVLA